MMGMISFHARLGSRSGSTKAWQLEQARSASNLTEHSPSVSTAWAGVSGTFSQLANNKPESAMMREPLNTFMENSFHSGYFYQPR